MLLKIELENVFSIKKMTLNLTKGRYLYKSNMVYDQVVNPLVIYGHNGSGKSSFFKAMAFFRSFISKGDNYPLEYNLLEASKAIKRHNSEYLLSKFEFDFKFNNKICSYILVMREDEVVSEEIFLGNEVLIYRTGEEYFINLYNKTNLKVKNKSKSVLLEHKNDFRELYDYLSNFSVVLDNRMNTISNIFEETKVYDLFIEYQNEIAKIYHELPFIPSFEIVKKNNEYLLKIGGEYLPINYMSKGSFNAYLIMSLILATPSNSVLFIDDLDTNIHPFVLEKMISLVIDKRIQLIFSSHNTHLMTIFRPDQIYFARLVDTSSIFKRLSDFKENIREINNIEKMFLSNNLFSNERDNDERKED